MDHKKPAFLLLLFLITAIFTCRAAIFTVTDNADNGPGTLRDAITQANALGSAGGANYIYFNLLAKGYATTIFVTSALPPITSSLIIDGTTQPGAALSANGAKVVVQGIGQWSSNINGFEVLNAADFEMYGMVVREFYTIVGGGSYTGGSALALLGTSAKVVIGAVNKGNVFYDNGTGILNFSVTTQAAQSNISYCEVKNNYIGVKENGVDFPLNLQSALVLSYVHQAVIGGATQNEGNLMAGSASFSPYYDGVNFLVQNNTFDLNIQNQPQGNVSSDAQEIYFTSNSPASALPSRINIIANVFITTVSVTNFGNLNLTVRGNYFGTTPGSPLGYNIDGPVINLSNVQGTTLIGGPDVSLGNVFTRAVQSAKYTINSTPVVSVQNSNTVELSHNSFYCNNDSPLLYLGTAYNAKPVQTTIDALSTNTASGTTKPGARVELFYTDKECTSCQPKTYIGAVNADAGGNWVYNTAFLQGYGVMVAGTLNHVSSEFTDPRLYEGNVVVQDVTCTQTGSITGEIVVNGAQATWIGPNGPVGGNSPNLTNAPAGVYTLQVNQFGCIKTSVPYTIIDYRPFVNDNGRTITPATCSSNNGSITGLVPNNNVLSVQWLDANGNIAGTEIDLINVPAGVYTLQLTGSRCTNIYGPVTIGTKNNSITVTPGTEEITPDQCSLHTGSIRNIKFSGGAGPYSFSWVNAAGTVISTDIDISNLSAGTYTLNISDSAPCDGVTATFVIDSDNSVIDAPAVNDIKVCGYEAILRVTNPQTGYSYRLYNEATDITPADEQVSGIFDIKLKANVNYYYVSKIIGTCESNRAKMEVQFSTETFSVANTITPNGDGINDYWDIKGLDAYPAASVKILNRNGQLLFQSIGYAKPFDGTYKGKKLPAGVYYYIIDVGSNCKLLSGSVTVIR